jgi:hypothetical protein
MTTGQTYNFKLYSKNIIYLSPSSIPLSVLVGTVPGQPSKPEYVSSSFTIPRITVKWRAPSYTGGNAITSYNLWIDDGAGNWPVIPISFTTLTTL